MCRNEFDANRYLSQRSQLQPTADLSGYRAAKRRQALTLRTIRAAGLLAVVASVLIVF